MNESKSTISSPTQPRNKIMLLAGYGYIVFFALLYVVKSLIPQGLGGWSDPPIYDYFIWLGLSVCISTIGIGYSYSAWTKNAKDYVEWFMNLSVKNTRWQAELMSNNPELSVWLARIFAPFMSLFGIVLIGYISFLIVSFIFGK